jgi:hypothetical protein
MNTIAIEPAVRDFLDVVRADLADLDPEERREILDGLEADLGELVAEQGPGALGDPHAYARELRAAAGIGEIAPARKRPIRDAVTAFLDACHGRYDAAVDRLPADALPVLAWLRPAWWVLRAWTAVQLVDVVFGDSARNGLDLLPSLEGLGLPLLLVAVAGSVLIGAGRWWPGRTDRLGARTVLLGLNAIAVVATPYVVGMLGSGWDDPAYERGYADGYQSHAADPARTRGLAINGEPVRNIYPYDAQGRPLAGVQLYDQDGKPVMVTGGATCPPNAVDTGEDPKTHGITRCEDGTTMDPVPMTVLYPWTNGSQSLLNVFPLASRAQAKPTPSPTAFSESAPPRLRYPMASVPKASLPGVRPGVQGRR